MKTGKNKPDFMNDQQEPGMDRGLQELQKIIVEFGYLCFKTLAFVCLSQP